LEGTRGATNSLEANITTIITSVVAGPFKSVLQSTLSSGEPSSECDA
jgi:hypothetical protein